MLRFQKGQALVPELVVPELVAETEQPVLNRSACGGRLSGLPWQQLCTSLSVWPLTAEPPDWLQPPAPCPARSLITSSSLHPSGGSCKGSAGLGSSDSLRLHAPCVGGVVLTGFH